MVKSGSSWTNETTIDSSTSSGDAILCACGDIINTLVYAFFTCRDEGLNIDSLSSSCSFDYQPGSVAMVEKMGKSKGPKPEIEDSISG
jgi:hypothetical protein